LGSLIERFTDLEVVGTGAGSTIFKGTSLDDGQVYAVKVVKWTQRGDERFLKQAMNDYRIASLLDHKNIIRVYSSNRIRKFLKTIEFDILMEYFSGRMLSDRGRLNMPDLISVFLQVAAALAYMHRIGFVHTDIKPENILVDDKAHVKVIDFGVACRRNETKDRVQGTPEFMAPEQTTKKPLDERTDIYNLGATMYKILTGKVVPENVNIAGVLGNGDGLSLLKAGVRDINAAVPGRLAHIIEKCSRRSRSKRYQRMAEVVEELTMALREVAPPDHEFLKGLAI
jgi:serine/threonine-protein kinase